MIKSFADRKTERLFQRRFSPHFPPDIQRRARIKLEILDAVDKLDDLRIPLSNRIERLHGDRKGQYGLHVNNQWRESLVSAHKLLPPHLVALLPIDFLNSH